MKCQQIKEMPDSCGANQATNGEVYDVERNREGPLDPGKGLLSTRYTMEINIRKYGQYVQIN